MTTTETWTIGRLLSWTSEYLAKHGSDSPRLDGEILLAHARNCERIKLYTAFDEEPDQDVKTAFREMVRRRAEGTPVAYLVGYKEFYSLTFEVNPDVLIPRPETEHLVVEALDRARDLKKHRSTPVLQIADIGTGSGAIAISVAKHEPSCQVFAIDVSAAALDVARRNAARLEVPERQIEFIESDLLTRCESPDKFDLVLSNPPYVTEAEYADLDSTVRDFEPRGALVSGPNGTEIIVRILEQAATRLASDGYLILELSPMLAPKMPELCTGAWQAPVIKKDLAGHARLAILQLKPDA